MRLLVFCVLVVLQLAHVVYAETVLPSSSETGNMKVLFRVLEKCGEVSDMGSCLKLKAVNLLDRALSIDAPLPVTDYLSIAKDPEVKDDVAKKPTDVKSEVELESSLPKNLDEKSSTLDTMLEDRVSRFLRSRTIQFTLPADVLEGRKKKDKGGMLLMAAMAMGGMMVQLAMSKIALIAGKALLIGKIALLLSAVIGLKKLLSSGGGDSHPQVVYATGGGDHGHSGGWGRRSMVDENAAQDLAYRGHRAYQTKEQ